MTRSAFRPQRLHVLLVLGFALAGGSAPLTAAAEEFHREGRPERHEFREHDVRRFHERELALWRAGAWHHEWHDGRYGWWWFAAGVWYFYERPVYPYPLVVASVTYVQPVTGPNMPGPPVSPQGTTVVTPPGAAPAYYYYCDPARAYYPAVPQCAVPWRLVPATPAAPPAPPAPPAPGSYGPPAPPAPGGYGPPPY